MRVLLFGMNTKANRVAQHRFLAATWGPRGPRYYLNAATRVIAAAALSMLATIAAAESPAKPSKQQPGAELSSITVEAERDRATFERRVNTFVSSITIAPYQQSLARWKKETLICPQVAGLPYLDGEYILSRFSEIAAAAGAPLAPNICRANLHILVSSVPDELIAEWSKRNPLMFGTAGGTKIRHFLHSSAPIRVWYNTSFFNADGRACRAYDEGIIICEQGAQIGLVRLNSLRDLTSVIVLVDARQIKEISMGQLAAYIAMVGLAEIRIDAKLGEAPTILHLFTDSANAPSLGMSTWDVAYLRALYHTEHEDKTQLLALKAAMLKDIVP
jgi:hypothetical protein